MHIAPGLEVLLSERLDLVRGRRVGLVSNSTGVLPSLVHAMDAFIEHSGIDLRALFSPEHGLHAAVADGATVGSGMDCRTGLPVYSLYGDLVMPTREQLMGIDLLVFDIQDVGARFYTYATTMSYCLEAAAEAGLPMLVLDRPNPINGVSVEGPVLDPEFSSFVGRYPIPIRHGMSIGELARLFNEAFGIRAELVVVSMKGWRREMWFDHTGLTWIAPSPNIPTMDTATVYPGTCLVEGTNVSEGRGTTRPFEWIGAPWIDGGMLARELNRIGLGGATFRPMSFFPTASKYAHQLCHGVQLHVRDRQRFRPVATGLHLLKAMANLHPQEFRWRPSREPGGVPPIDRLVGTDQVRQRLDDGWPIEDIISSWEPELLKFGQLARECFNYR